MPTYQTITVDITPGAKEKPVINASQFDNGRPFNVALTWGGVPFTDAGNYDIEMHVRKPDGNIVTAVPDSIINEVCAFLTTEQMCACHGINECEIVLLDNDIQIGTGNFILDVEKAPDEGGIQSASEIANLASQIAQIVPEVIGDDYYNKSQTDALLANKADISDLPDMTDYYNKSQTDTLLNAKADTSSLATVATTGDYDDLINKPTIPAAQVQSDYAQADNTQVDYIKNKPDIDAMIAAALLDVMPVDSVTGNPCSFDTDIATSLVGLSAEIVASGGGGTPSTPIPIVGISSLDIVRCGVNLCYAENSSLFPRGDNLPIAENVGTYTAYVRVPKNTTLYFKTSTITNRTIFYGVENAPAVGVMCHLLTFTTISADLFSVNSGNYEYIAFYYSNESATNVMACVNQADTTAYEPYNGQTFTIDLGGTRYGGVYTADGKLRVTHANIASYNGESINEPWLSSMDVYVPNTTPSIGAQVVYPLTTPIEIDVSAISVNAISGVNNISSNGGGDISVRYKDSIQHYIDNH